jgi:hypothetical protein
MGENNDGWKKQNGVPDDTHRLQIWIWDRPKVLLPEHQLLICDRKLRKLEGLYFGDSSELQNSNVNKFVLYYEPKWHNTAKRWELVLAKVFESTELNWFYCVTVTGVRFIAMCFFFLIS